MEVLARIESANGWALSLVGISTVFITLICIWTFIGVFAKLTTKRGHKGDFFRNPLVQKNPQEPQCPIPIPEDDLRKEESLAAMAAAAAIAVHRKRKSRTKILARTAGQNVWVISGRHRNIYNTPPLNPWGKSR